MKRVEKFVLILSIVTAIKVWAVPFVTQIYKRQLMLSTPPEAMANAATSLVWVSVIALILTNLICGIWLLFDSKEEKLTPWVWFLFGIVFGINSIIVFYLYILLTEIKLKWREQGGIYEKS